MNRNTSVHSNHQQYKGGGHEDSIIKKNNSEQQYGSLFRDERKKQWQKLKTTKRTQYLNKYSGVCSFM